MTHPILDAHGSFTRMKLGKQQPKNDPRTLMFAAYKTPDLPEPPAIVDYFSEVTTWPMFRNDQWGDCTCAAAGHMIETWTAQVGTLVVPDETVIEQLYIPNTGTDDTGRVEIDVLNYWRQNGVGNDKITAYVSVDPDKLDSVRAATWLFGGLYIGIALPKTAQDQDVWDVVGDGKTGDSQPGSWGGHAVNVVGYDADGLTVITWGATHKMTWAFWSAYIDECYALISSDWVDATTTSPSGFNLYALMGDLKKVEA